MRTVLKVVGAVWAVLGLLSVIFAPARDVTSQHFGLQRPMAINVVLFIGPGLFLYGVGSLMKTKWHFMHWILFFVLLSIAFLALSYFIFYQVNDWSSTKQKEVPGFIPFGAFSIRLEPSQAVACLSGCQHPWSFQWRILSDRVPLGHTALYSRRDRRLSAAPQSVQ
jgi:hypothetical protein